jgi:putative addiction module component (TIGR02574 family)
MANAVDKLIQDALSLSADDRAELADRLVESLDPLTDEEIRQAWAAEAIRRRNEVRDGLVQTIPEDVVAKRVRDLVRK